MIFGDKVNVDTEFSSPMITGRRKIASFNISSKKEERKMFEGEFKINLKAAEKVINKKRENTKNHSNFKNFEKNKEKFRLTKKRIFMSERKSNKKNGKNKSMPFFKKTENFFKSLEENKTKIRNCKEKNIITEALNKSQILNDNFLYRLKNIQRDTDKDKINKKEEAIKIRKEIKKSERALLNTKSKRELAFSLTKSRSFKISVGKGKRRNKIIKV